MTLETKTQPQISSRLALRAKKMNHGKSMPSKYQSYCKRQIKTILLVQFSQLSFCWQESLKLQRGEILWSPTLKTTTDIFGGTTTTKRTNKSELAPEKNLPADLHSKKKNNKLNHTIVCTQQHYFQVQCDPGNQDYEFPLKKQKSFRMKGFEILK